MGLSRRLSRLAVKAAEDKADDLAVKPKPKAPAVIRGRSGTPEDTAKSVLREAAKPSKGRPSYADWRKANSPATIRRASPRMISALSDPAVVRGINETVERGVEGGGKAWYNTDPLLERMGGDEVAYKRLMDVVAATSPRSNVQDNVRTGSYYNYLLANDLPIQEKPAKGYGSIAQNNHRDNVRGVAERGGWDVMQNPKPASFSENLQGNQQVATVDTHNFRLPGILSQDPRFLATSVKAGTKGDIDTVAASLARRYPSLPEEEIALATKNMVPGKPDLGNYRPQEWVKRGYLSPEQAAQDPVLWATKPQPNEYGYYEAWQQEQAAKMGISPAQYQASMWLGGGDETGLGSAPEPFVATVEARVRYTADALGMDPEKLLEMYLKGDVPLMARGGSVKALSDKYDTELEPDAETAFERFRAALPEQLRSDFDYDLRGAWWTGEQADEGGHMTDRFKKPNHPTFSDQSQYSSPAAPGGHWSDAGGGKSVFWASPHNLQQSGMAGLQHYFNQAEPGNAVVAPLDYRLPPRR